MELLVNYKGEEQVLQVEDTDVISFPSGLIGFSQWRKFVLLEDPEELPIAVLQCIDDTDVSFLVTDPVYVVSQYRFDLSPEDRRELGLTRPGLERTLCTLAIKERPVMVTANLLAPIVINSETRMARQVILDGSGYTAQHPLLVAADNRRKTSRNTGRLVQAGMSTS